VTRRDTVEWTNEDSTPHTVTSGLNSTPDGKFGGNVETGDYILVRGKTQSVRFEEEGEYHYFCTLHPNENGIVRVGPKKKRSEVGKKKQEAAHGHFFFVDIVGLSDANKGGTESQVNKIRVLQRRIATCRAYSSGSSKKPYVNLTGDGMVIGFPEGPKLPLKLAIELHKKLIMYNKGKSDAQRVIVRIGIDSAPILRYIDLFGKPNVWGEGIVHARRIMDFGDSNDIFMTERSAEGLKQFDEYRDVIHYVGETRIKHGKIVKIYAAYRTDFGNPNPKLPKPCNDNKVDMKSHEDAPASEVYPIVRIVNFGVEPPASSNAQRTQYHPNVINDGAVPVNNVRISHLMLDHMANLAHVLELEHVIKVNSIAYPGSILPKQSARVDSFTLLRTPNEVSNIFWIEYNYEQNRTGKAIFDIRFRDFRYIRHFAYLPDDIHRETSSS
jgi:hypothetical protein